MNDSPETIAGIPDPIPGEPTDLRRAILDEIEDHLRCATQRELRRAHSTSSASDRGADLAPDRASGWASDRASDRASDSSSDPDLDSARRRALDRFGDPAAIARRLWLDAMKGQLETLMTNRILIGFNIVLLLAVLVLGGLLVVMVRDGRAFHRELVERMMIQEASAREAREAENASAVSPETSLEAARIAASYDWPSIDVEVVDEDTGAPLSGVLISMLGDAYVAGKQSTLRGTTDSDGNVRLGPMRPGAYYGKVDRDGYLKRDLPHFVVRPGPENHRRVQLPSTPDPRSIPVAIEVTWPEVVTDLKAFALIRLTPTYSTELVRGPTAQLPFVDVAVRRDGKVAPLTAKTAEDVRRQQPNYNVPFDLDLEWDRPITLLEGLEYVPSVRATRFGLGSELDPRDPQDPSKRRWPTLTPSPAEGAVASVNQPFALTLDLSFPWTSGSG